MNDPHKPLNIPKDRSCIIRQAIDADDGACSTGACMVQQANTTLGVKMMDDGPASNSRRIAVVMMSIKVPGVDGEFHHRIGEFDEKYETIARQFCAWFNSKSEGSGT